MTTDTLAAVAVAGFALGNLAALALLRGGHGTAPPLPKPNGATLQSSRTARTGGATQ